MRTVFRYIDDGAAALAGALVEGGYDYEWFCREYAGDGLFGRLAAR